MIEIKVRKIRYMYKHVNLWTIEAINDFIQDGAWSGGYKESRVYRFGLV
jgi:hypothetical protein